MSTSSAPSSFQDRAKWWSREAMRWRWADTAALCLRLSIAGGAGLVLIALFGPLDSPLAPAVAVVIGAGAVVALIVCLTGTFHE